MVCCDVCILPTLLISISMQYMYSCVCMCMFVRTCVLVSMCMFVYMNVCTVPMYGCSVCMYVAYGVCVRFYLYICINVVFACVCV